MVDPVEGAPSNARSTVPPAMTSQGMLWWGLGMIVGGVLLGVVLSLTSLPGAPTLALAGIRNTLLWLGSSLSTCLIAVGAGLTAGSVVVRSLANHKK